MAGAPNGCMFSTKKDVRMYKCTNVYPTVLTICSHSSCSFPFLAKNVTTDSIGTTFLVQFLLVLRISSLFDVSMFCIKLVCVPCGTFSTDV